MPPCKTPLGKSSIFHKLTFETLLLHITFDGWILQVPRYIMHQESRFKGLNLANNYNDDDGDDDVDDDNDDVDDDDDVDNNNNNDNDNDNMNKDNNNNGKNSKQKQHCYKYRKISYIAIIRPYRVHILL
jgi:hypothetical protein